MEELKQKFLEDEKEKIKQQELAKKEAMEI
jgi:hypothetical protein